MLPDLQRDGHGGIGLGRADAVDARHRGDDDDVAPLEQRPRRRVAHAVDLLVERGFLLDIGVGARDVGFRLVVVVVRDEILDRVVREEALHLAIELRRQRLVGRQDQRRALHVLDHLRHGVGLARAGDAEQHLVAVAPQQALGQLLDRGRLVARRVEIGLELERLARQRRGQLAPRALPPPDRCIAVCQTSSFLEIRATLGRTKAKRQHRDAGVCPVLSGVKWGRISRSARPAGAGRARGPAGAPRHPPP